MDVQVPWDSSVPCHQGDPLNGADRLSKELQTGFPRPLSHVWCLCPFGAQGTHGAEPLCPNADC